MSIHKVIQLFPEHLEVDLTVRGNTIFEDVLYNHDNKSIKPFSDILIEFFDAFSTYTLNSNEYKMYPEIISTAFWLRKQSIKNKLKGYIIPIENTRIVSFGTFFHICPSNVDTVFIYSFFASLICGNSNILRLHHHISEQTRALLKILNTIILDPKFEVIKKSNCVITYEPDEEINKIIMQNIDGRILWGGDSTVNMFRSLKAKSNIKDITFVDKNSMFALNCTEFLNLSSPDKSSLIKKFIADSLTFNQLACSSPSTVALIGNSIETTKTKQEFWNLVDSQLGDTETISDTTLKLNFIFEKAAHLRFKQTVKLKNITVLYPEENIKNSKTCGRGTFFCTELEVLKDISNIVTGKDQTLSYFGFSKDELEDLVVYLNGRAIHRIVPIGKSLEFDIIWDGYDLINELTKKVRVY